MMEEIYRRKNLSLITLEKLREFKANGKEVTYKFVCIGRTKFDNPQYHLYVLLQDKMYIMVNGRITFEGPKVRVLNMFPGVLTVHDLLSSPGDKLQLSTEPEDPPTKPSDFLDD